ncbi:hypothetical protein KKA09_03265 [Patescibacteria group bacterium]|nr:hypothetical protein [Patescibacteria group bacterium]
MEKYIGKKFDFDGEVRGGQAIEKYEKKRSPREDEEFVSGHSQRWNRGGSGDEKKGTEKENPISLLPEEKLEKIEGEEKPKMKDEVESVNVSDAEKEKIEIEKEIENDKTKYKKYYKEFKEKYYQEFISKGKDEKNARVEASKKARWQAILEVVGQKVEQVSYFFLSEEEVKALEELKQKDPAKFEEEFRKISRETWQFAFHGFLKKNPNTGKKTLSIDLDVKVCQGLFKKAGFKNIENAKYIAPGKSLPKYLNIDTSGNVGIGVKGKIAHIDHHLWFLGKKDICAARWVYLALLSKGFLEKTPILNELTRLVSRMDRAEFFEIEDYFEQGHKAIAGLLYGVQFKQLYEFFTDAIKEKNAIKEKLKEDKDLTSGEKEKLEKILKENPVVKILSDKELESYNLLKASERQKENNKKSKKILEKLREDGFIIKTKFGEVVIDIGKKIPCGYQAVRAYGCPGYVIYDSENNSFFITINKADLSNVDIEQGEVVRQTMKTHPPYLKEPLVVSLGEIIEKLGRKIPEKGGLKEYCEAQEMDLRFKKFIVSPVLGRNRYITRKLDRFAVFPDGFKPKREYYKVRIKKIDRDEKGEFYLLEVLDDEIGNEARVGIEEIKDAINGFLETNFLDKILELKSLPDAPTKGDLMYVGAEEFNADFIRSVAKKAIRSEEIRKFKVQKNVGEIVISDSVLEQLCDLVNKWFLDKASEKAMAIEAGKIKDKEPKKEAGDKELIEKIKNKINDFLNFRYPGAGFKIVETSPGRELLKFVGADEFNNDFIKRVATEAMETLESIKGKIKIGDVNFEKICDLIREWFFNKAREKVDAKPEKIIKQTIKEVSAEGSGKEKTKIEKKIDEFLKRKLLAELPEIEEKLRERLKDNKDYKDLTKEEKKAKIKEIAQKILEDSEEKFKNTEFYEK